MTQESKEPLLGPSQSRNRSIEMQELPLSNMQPPLPSDRPRPESFRSMEERNPEEGWEYKFFEPEPEIKVKEGEDNTYNPLLIRVSKKAAQLSTFWRYLFLAILVILFIPHDVYAPNWDPFGSRWGFWANKVSKHSMPLDQIENNLLSISLENCNLYLQPGSSQSLEFKVSRRYGIDVNQTSSTFEVKDPKPSTIPCDIFLTAPTNGTALLPEIYVNFNGTKTDLLISDKNADFSESKFLQFKEGAQFRVVGKAAEVSLRYHKMNKLRLKFDNIFATLDNIASPNITLISNYGYLNGIMSPQYAQAYMQVTQPYGAICLTAMDAHQVFNTSCPTKEERKQPLEIASSGQVLDKYDCFVKAQLCQKQSADNCETLLPQTDTARQNWKVMIEDGNVHVSYFRPLEENVDFTPDKENATQANLRLLEEQEELELFSSGRIERKKLLQAVQAATFKPRGQAISFVRDFTQVNGQSRSLIYTISDKIVNNPGVDVVHKFYVEGWGYRDVWLYTNKRPYLQAQVWLLSFVSLGLLKPQEAEDTIVLLDRYCPARPVSIDSSGEIAEYLSTYMPTTAKSTVALIAESSTFYEFKPQSDGSYKADPISISDSVLILILLIVGFVLTIFASIVVIIILWQLTKLFNIDYQDFVQRQRRLAITRKRHNQSPLEKKTQAEPTFVTKKGIMGVWKGWIVNKRPQELVLEKQQADNRRVQKKKNPEGPKNKQKQPLKDYLTFFQIPQLYIESMRRKAANSLGLFIESIPMSERVFPQSRFSSQDNNSAGVPGQSVDFSRVPKLLLSDFQNKYSEFCANFGYQARILEDEEDTFNAFRLKIEYIQDRKTRVYAKLRWKQENERKNKAKSSKQMKEEQQLKEESSVKLFLQDECVASSFQKDYIMIPQLQKAYNAYCSNYGIAGVQKEPLEGNKQLANFGAILEGIPIPYVLNICEPIGIVPDAVVISGDAMFDSGFVRKNNLPKTGEISRWQKFKNWVAAAKNTLFATNQPIPNCLLVLVQLLAIIITGLPLVFIVAWAVVERSFLTPNVDSHTFTIGDVLSPNSVSPWWETTNSGILMLIFLLIFLIFYVLALFELMSYYATFYSFTGSIKIYKTGCKKCLSNSFYTYFVILFVMYVGYICLVALWMVLGAILNPNKFLPFATAVATFVMFVATKVKALNDLTNNIEDKIQQFVQEQLQSLISDTMTAVFGNDQGADVMAEGLITGELDKPARLLFQKAILAFLGDKVQATPEQTEAIANGDINQLIALISQGIGVHQGVIKAIVGLVLQDNPMLIESIGELSTIIGLDADIGSSLAQIALDTYNPDAIGINSVEGKIVLAIKKLFRKVFPVFPPDLIDIIFQLISEGDPLPLADLVKQNSTNSKVALITLVGQYLHQRQGMMESASSALVEEVMPKREESNFYLRLFSLMRGQFNKSDHKRKIDQLSNDLDFPLNGVLEFLIAFEKKDTVLSRIAIENLMDELFVKMECPEHQQARLEQAKKNILALYSLIHGRSVSGEIMNEMLYMYMYNRDRLLAMVSFVKGESAGVAVICDVLNIASAKGIISEIYQIIHQQSSFLTEITANVGLLPKQYEIVKATIDFLSGSAELAVFMRDMKQKTAEEYYFSELRDFEKTHYLDSLEGKLKEALQVFYRFEILQVEQFFPATGSFMGITDKRILKDFNRICFKSGTDKPDNLTVNIKAKIFKMYSIMHENEIALISKELKKMLTIPNFNALRAISLIVFSYNVENIPMNMEGERKPYNFRSVKKRPEWIDEHSRWLSQFLKIDIQAFNLVVDLISGNPYLIFGTSEEFMPANKSVIKVPLQDEERMAILLGLFDCKDKNTLRCIAGVWIRQFELINKGWSWITPVCRKLHLPSAFINMIRSSSSTSSLNGQFDQRSFQQTVRRFIYAMLKKPPRRINTNIPDDLEEGMEEVYTSPLQITTEESQQRVANFKQILTYFIQIWTGRKSVFKKVLGFNREISDYLTKMIKYIHKPSEMALITLILDMADHSDDFFEGPHLGEAEIIEGKLMFLHIVLMILAGDLAQGLGESHPNSDDSMSKPMTFLLTSIAELTEKFVELKGTSKEDKIKFREGQSLPSGNFFYNMFQLNMYNLISKKMFARLGVSDLKEEDYDAIIGVMIGAATQNHELLRNCILELLKSLKYQKVIYSALICVAMRDYSLEKEIKRLCKVVGLKGSVGIALMHIRGNETGLIDEGVKILAKEDIGKNKCEDIASIISILKGSVSNVTPLAETIGMKPSLLRSLIAVMNGSLADIGGFLPDLSKTLGIGSFAALEHLIYLAHGDSSKLYDLSKSHSDKFQLNRPEVAEALIFISQTGRNLAKSEGNLRIDTGNLNWAVGVLTGQLSWAVGYRRGEYETHDAAEEEQEESKTPLASPRRGNESAREVNMLDVSIDPTMEVVDQSVEVNDIRGEEIANSLRQDIELLTKAVWSDQQSLHVLSQNIASKSHNPVWSNFPQKREVILETALKRVKSRVDKELIALEVAMSRTIGYIPGRMKKLSKINKDSKADPPASELKRLLKPVQEMEKRAEWEREKWALVYGCSYNVTLYNSTNQTYWFCRTCCPDTNDEFAICESCAVICHQGHDLKRGNHGKQAEIICDCGNGWISDVETNQLNSNHQWREMMTEKDKHHCFFNQTVFRPDSKSYEKLRTQIHGAADSGIGRQATASTQSIADDTGHTLDDDEVDVVEAVTDSYKHEQFVDDLEYTLTRFWKSKRTKVALARFRKFFDHQLHNEISFWEFFILLAYGNCRVSFLPLLTTNAAITEDQIKVASLFVSDKQEAQGMEFDSLAGLISFNEGDHFNFSQYGEGVTDALGIVGQKNYSPVMKAKMVMMLVHGPPFEFFLLNYPKSAKPEKLEQSQYVQLFKRLTANVWEKVMGLHMLIKLKRKNLCQFTRIIEGEIRGLPQRGVEEPVYRYAYTDFIMSNLLQKTLGIDREQVSYTWFLALIQMSIGHEPGFDGVAQEIVENNSSLVRLYKAFLKPDYQYMKPMIKILEQEMEIDPQLAACIISVVNGSKDAINELVVTHYFRKIMEFDDDIALASVSDFIEPLYLITCGVTFELQQNLKKVVTNLGGQAKKAKVIASVDGLVNENSQSMRLLFQSEDLNPEMESLAYSIIDIANYTWDYRDIREILNFLRDEAKQAMPDLCAGGEVSEDEFDFIGELLEALNGDLSSVGKISDHLIYENKSSKCQMLVAFFTGNTGFEVDDDEDEPEDIREKKFLKKKFIREIESVFTFLLEFAPRPRRGFGGRGGMPPMGRGGMPPMGRGGMPPLGLGRGGAPGQPPQALGAPAAPAAPTIDGAQMIKDLKVPSLIYMLTSMQKSLVDKIFDVKREFSYNDQDPRMVSDLMVLTETNAGVPDFENIIEQASKKTNIERMIKTPYFPLFIEVKNLEQDRVEISEFLNKIGMSQDDLADQLDYFHDTQNKMIEFRLSRFYKLVFQIQDVGSIEALRMLIAMMAPLFENNPGMLKVIEASYYMLVGEKKNIFSVLPVILKLVVQCMTSRSHSIQIFGANLNDKVIDGIVNWFSGILALLDKDKRITMNQIADLIVQMVEIVASITEELGYQKQGASPVMQAIGNMADAMIGIISICRGDLSGIERIAKLLGGYDAKRIKELFSILQKFARFLGSAPAEQPQNQSQQAIFSAAEKGDAITLKEMFRMFDKDKSGSLDFNQFCELCKYMGLFLNRETLLQLYAEADENDNNNIEFQEFQLAINLLKKQVGNDALAMMGLTKQELVQMLIIAAIFLLLLFAFIFMGVTAFSTADGFSAVINSILPAAAGLSMSGGGSGGSSGDNSKLFRTLQQIIAKIVKAMRIA